MMDHDEFYEKECVGRVKAIAQMLDDLYRNAFDRDDYEGYVSDMENAWQTELEEKFYEDCGDDAEPEVDFYELEGEKLIEALKESGIEYYEADAEEYLDKKEILATYDACCLRDYFEDVLDIEYIVDRNKEYRSVNVTIATGGPHIEVRTGDHEVHLWWGGKEASWGLRYETVNEIDEIFEEMYSW